ncbi:hypothetical protein GT94_13685 [Geobacillus stearothermophilus]|nr:hypothetical protein GT94_13685 [Geobacillus stearothermophilus]
MDNPKFQNKKLRQAMAYAINNQEVADRLYHGLRFPATTLIPPSFPGYHDSSIKGYTYNPEKQNSCLMRPAIKMWTATAFAKIRTAKSLRSTFWR